MGIFKKAMNLFKGEPSQANTANVSSIRALVPRARRVPLTGIHELKFEAYGKHYEVSNVSVSGMGLIKDSSESWPAVGSVLKGMVSIQGETFPVEARLVHLTGKIVGFRFEGKIADLQMAIRKFLEVEMVGVSMEPFTGKYQVNLLESGTPHWYYGKGNSEIFIMAEEDEVAYFYLSFLGHYLEARTDKSVHSGFVVENDDTEQLRIEGSTMVKWEKTLNLEKAEMAKKFIESTRCLKDSHRNQILQIISNAITALKKVAA